MIELVPFRREHFELIQPDPFFADIKDAMQLAPLIRRGNAVTMLDTAKGEVLACWGYVWRRSNVYWLWSLPSARGSRNIIRIVRHARAWIATLPAGTRVEASVKAGFVQGVKFVKAIGFVQETPEDAPARLYDGKNDHHLFGLCIEPDIQGINDRGLLEDFGFLAGTHQLRQGHGRICPL